MTPAEQVSEQLLQLQAALVAGNSGIPTMLRTIHTKLRDDADIVTLLSPEEIGILVAGLMKQTNTVIATAATKKSTKALKNISLDDL